jgi:hypothetical protein
MSTLLSLLREDPPARLHIVKSLTNPTDSYSAEENDAIALGLNNFKTFESFRTKTVTMESPLSKGKTLKLPGDNIYWGYSETVVRASPSQVAASILHEASNENAADNDVEKTVLDMPNEHTKFEYLRKTGGGFGVSDRDFVYSSTWKKMGSSNYVVRHRL